MTDVSLAALYHYRPVSERIGSAGMPTEAQLAEVARAGFEVVINLDQRDSRYALPDERATVEALGMTYVQIPVIWTRPTHEDLQAFLAALDRFADKRVFVHCVANYRASVFLTLYRILRLGWPREEALRDLTSFWQPDAVWQQFIESELPV